MQPREEPDWRQAPGATRGLLSGPSRGPATPLPCWRRARGSHVTEIAPVSHQSPVSLELLQLQCVHRGHLVPCASVSPFSPARGHRALGMGTSVHRHAELWAEAPVGLPSPIVVPRVTKPPDPWQGDLLGSACTGGLQGVWQRGCVDPVHPKKPSGTDAVQGAGSGCPAEVSWGMPGSEGLLSWCPSFGVCSGETPSCKEPSAPARAGSPSSPPKGALILVTRCPAPWWLIAVSPAEDYSLKQERSSRSR